jgi:hypothetical protein
MRKAKLKLLIVCIVVGLFGAVYAQAAPPANDNCADAEQVGNVTNQPFDTTNATFDGPGSCMDSPNIWYCYTATCSGSVTVSLCGSSYDTKLAVYEGCSCDPLGAIIDCNDDYDYCGLQSQVTFAATEGNKYLIEVGGYESDTGQGVMSISCVAPPANDNCANAEQVGNVTNQPFDTTNATFDGPGSCMDSPNIWYCYTATCSGSVTVSLCGSSYDTMLAVYKGCSCDPLGTNIACNDDYCGLQSIVTFAATEGNTYLIEVGGYSSATGLGVMSINCVAETPCACCLSDGSCMNLFPGVCTYQGGIPQGPGTNCATINCGGTPPFITKYVQQPDLSETGIDVDATYDTSGMSPWPPQLLADDFNCTTPGPITDIHIWGSWYHDFPPYQDPRNVEFVLSIHSNIPADPCNPNSYSMPGELLWSRYFGPGEFEVYEEASNLTEGYYVPCIEYYEYPGDSICWRYDFYMPPLEAFMQEGDPCNPVTYWLDVQAFNYSTSEPVRFGWKTSVDHWMDDAVFAVGVEGDHSPWQELRYPQGHPYYPNSIDLAFAITTQNWLKPKPPVPHLKWSQPPIEIDPGSGIPIYCGWDEPSLLIEPGYWKVVADDFRCLGTMPVTSIHWWGSYVGWDGNDPPMSQPVAWQIGFWSNVPAGINAPYSYPKDLLWQVEVPADRVDVNNVGRDYFPQRPSDTCFQYHVRLNPEEYFWQMPYEDNIFWLSIAAVYPVYPDCACNPDMNCDGVVNANDIDPFNLAMTDPVEYHNVYPNCDINNGDADCDGDIDSADYAILVCLIDGGTTCCPQGTATEHPWGWKTRPWHWMDDAVTFWLEGPFEPGIILDPTSNGITPLGGPEGSYDVAFELDTDPNWIKWEQPYTGLRNWGNYTDVYSNGTEYEGELTINAMAADDWLCERRTPVSAIVWWGSYMYYQYSACQGEQPPPPVKPDYFLLNIWTDVPVGDPCNIYEFSHPGRKVWEYKARDYDEVMVGYDKRAPTMGAGDDGGFLEPVFRYSVRLSEEDWFCQPDVNSVYWLSIVAVWDEYEPLNDYSWGWTNHKHVFGDDGVQGWPDYDDPNFWSWQELIDWQTEESRDLSFMLFTEPDYCCKCANFNVDTIVNFLDYADFADDWLWVGPAGGYNNSDLNCDGSVDFYDLKIFTDQWLSSCP